MFCLIDQTLCPFFFFLFSFRNLWGTWTKGWRFRLPWKRCIKGESWFANNAVSMLFCADPDPSLCLIFTYLSAGCVGCWECQRDHRPCLDRQGWLKLESSFLFFLLIFNMVACLCSDVMCFSRQDPTDQVAIDNFMVQQLDGTVNEWGWCKQKVQYQIFN